MIDVTLFDLTPATPRHETVGQTIGQWTLLGFGRTPPSWTMKAVAQCSCGSEPKVVQLQNIRSGASTNCGCARIAKMTTHGAATRRDPVKRHLYRVWRSMMDRCYSTRNASYGQYGERGITVCERWHSPVNFQADMGTDFMPGMTLERLDNDLGYSPENCIWADPLTQTRNRRTTLRYNHNGEDKTLAEWASEFGLPYRLLWKRLSAGWPFEEAIQQERSRGTKRFRAPAQS